MSDLLTQEELNALLSGIDDFDAVDGLELDDGGEMEPSESQIRNYDFSRREKIIRGHMPFLDSVAETFSRLFRNSLSGFLGQALEIERSGIQVQHFFEFTQGWPQQTLFSFAKFAPLKGRVVVAIEPNLAFTIIDHYFGGQKPTQLNHGVQRLTPAMMRVIELSLSLIFNDLRKAWKPVMALDIDYSPVELNPDFAHVAGPDEIVVMTSMRVMMKGGEGNLNIAMPYSMVEPVKEQLSSNLTGSPEDDRLWKDFFCRQLLNAEIYVASQLARKQMTIREVMRLKKGDVIAIDQPETATLNAKNIALYYGKPGLSGGRYALQIAGKLERHSKQRNKNS